MTEQQNIAAAQIEYDNQKKTPGIAYLLWFFFGAIGGHRFYAGDTGYALGMLFTLGGFGVWALIDVFLIGKRIRTINSQKQRTIFAQHGMATPAAT